MRVATMVGTVGIDEVVADYVAIWNERDGERRQALIGRALTEDATYLDPVAEGEGTAGIDAMLAGLQAQFPGHEVRRLGEIDAHHGRARFGWELIDAATGARVVAGVDFAELAADGRLRSVTGFFDETPGLAGMG